jgi:hypothetical protein
MQRVGAIEAEAAMQKRAPGLQIVIVQKDGSQHVAHQPPQPMPMLDAPVPVSEAEPVPVDTDAE